MYKTENHATIKATIKNYISFEYNMITHSLCSFKVLDDFGTLAPFMSEGDDILT